MNPRTTLFRNYSFLTIFFTFLSSCEFSCDEGSCLDLVKSNVVAYSHSKDGSVYSYFDISKGRQVTIYNNTNDTIIHASGIGGNWGQLSYDGKYLAYIYRNSTIRICDLAIDSVIYSYKDSSQRIAKLQWNPTRYSLLFLRGNASYSELYELYFLEDKKELIKPFSFGDVKKHVNFSYNVNGEFIAVDNPTDTEWQSSIIDTKGNVVFTHQEMFFGWLDDSNNFLVARNDEEQELSVFRKSLDDPELDQYVVNAKGYYAWFNQTYNGNVGYLAVEADTRVGKIDSLGSYLELHSDEKISYESRAEFYSNGYLYSKGIGNGINVFSVQFEDKEKLDLNHFMRLGGHAFEPRLSPSEDRLLFQARAWDGQNLDTNGAYYVDTSTGQYHLIEQSDGFCESSGNCIEWVAWLNDEKVIYTIWRSPFPKRAVVIHDIIYDQKEIIIDSVDYGIAHLEPSESADKISFIKWTLGSNNCSVMIHDIERNEMVEIVELQDVHFSEYSQPSVYFSWETNGLFVVYTEEQKKILKVLKIDIETGSQKLVFELENRFPTGLDYSSNRQELLLTHESEQVINYYEVSL